MKSPNNHCAYFRFYIRKASNCHLSSLFQTFTKKIWIDPFSLLKSFYLCFVLVTLNDFKKNLRFKCYCQLNPLHVSFYNLKRKTYPIDFHAIVKYPPHRGLGNYMYTVVTYVRKVSPTQGFVRLYLFIYVDFEEDAFYSFQVLGI